KLSGFHTHFKAFCDLHRRVAAFEYPVAFLSVQLELWVFKGLFGLKKELLAEFQETYVVSLTVRIDTNYTVLYIHGPGILRTFAVLLLIVSLACNLRIKRNRARAWARGLQSPVWWASRYFI
uniref:Uncharacterized protein n=1 Tax=Cricetulus griseus TaxID=10029 RepID=A0A8C2MBI3_CRIGR